MSMQELPDDELDKLFRKSAEEFESEFNPQAWASMRKKLDDEDGKVGGIAWWKAGIIALLLLTMGVAGYYLWPETIRDNKEKALTNSSISKDQNPAEKVSSKSNLETNPSKSAQANREIAQQFSTKEKSSPENSEAAIIKNTPSEKPNLPKSLETEKEIHPEGANKNNISKVPTIDNRALLRRAKADSKPVKQSGVENGEKTALVTTNQNPTRASSNQKTKHGRATNLAKTNPKNHLTFQPTNAENQNTTKEKSLKPSSVKAIESNSIEPLADANSGILLAENSHSTLLTLNKLTGHGWQFLKVSWPAPTVAYTPPPPPLAIPKKEDVSAFFRKGLSARILAGPDLSFISSSQMMKNPTLLLSIMFEYRFSKRLSLQAGVAKSSKLYTATGEQYQWPDAWYSQKVRPTEIDADCKVLDIPLNLRFDLSQRAKSRLFVASGISSYLMLNEKYDYTYPAHSYPKWKNWEGSTGNYWFGVMNFSMGFERQIGRNLSIQAEPYFKLPLAQVGLGKIKLNTSGIFISARYRLGRF